MFKILIIFFILVSSTISTPLILSNNSARLWYNDSILSIHLNNKNIFLKNHILNFQATNSYYASNDGNLSANRLILYFSDSLDYNWSNIVVATVFDQKGQYGVNVDWATGSERGAGYLDVPKFDLFKLLMNFKIGDVANISLGKKHINWGQLQLGGLLLSDYNVGFTGFFQEYYFGPFTIKGVTTQLNSNPWGHLVTDSTEITARFFSAGRVEFYRECFGLSISQSVIYAGLGRSFEIPYLIPIYLYHYAQMSNWRYGNNGDNIYGGMDFYLNFISDQLTFYGELFIDDLQKDRTSDGNNAQDNVAFMVGVKWAFTNGLYGFIEGGQINSFVYNHIAGDELKYRNKNGFIGSPLGPDQQLVFGEIGYKSKFNIKIEYNYWYQLSGSKNIDYVYDSVKGTRNDNIPYGIIENKFSNWVDVKYTWKRILAELSGGFIYHSNKNNVEDLNSINYFLGISLKSGIKFSAKEK